MSKYQIPTSVVKASRDEIDELELLILKQENKGEEPTQVEKLPDDLSGYYFVVAPLPYLDGTFVLNGDGMIYRLELTGGKPKLKTRIAKTPCYYADLAIQLQPNKYPDNFKFYNGGPSRRSQALGTRNQLNTAFLKTNKQLFVTFDAGRPYEIDPDSLEILAPIGNTQNWQEIFPLCSIFATNSNPAHPVYNINRNEIFTINYSTGYKGKYKIFVQQALRWIKHKLSQTENPFVKNPLVIRAFTNIFRYGYAHLVRYNTETKEFSSWEMMLPDGQPVAPEQTLHQMAITEDYIIFMDIAFKIEFSQIFSAIFLEGIDKWDTNINKIQRFLQKFQNNQKIIVNNLTTLLNSASSEEKQDKNQTIDKAKINLFRFGAWIYSIFIRLIPPQPYTNLYIIPRKSVPKKNQNVKAFKYISEINSESESENNSENNPKKRKIRVQKVTIPREVSHFTVDYSNPDNKITIHIGHNNGSDVTEWVGKYDLPARRNKLRKELAGMIVGTTDLGCLSRYIIDAKAGVISDVRVMSDPRYTWSLSVYTYQESSNESTNETNDKTVNQVKNIYWMSWGFSWEIIPERIYQAYKNSDYRHMHYTKLPKDYKPTQLIRLNTETMQIEDSFEFPYGHFACTPQFIPKTSTCPQDRDPSTHGYIVCVVLADNPENPNQPQDEFWILDADDFNNNPVYRLQAPLVKPSLNIGLTIHSMWLESNWLEKNNINNLQDERRKKRQKSVYEDYSTLIIEKSNSNIKELFEQVIYPHFIEQTSEKAMEDLLSKTDS